MNGWNAPDFSQHPEHKAFTNEAPKYRLLRPGLNIEGKCLGNGKNGGSSCPAKGNMVWCNVGKKSNGEDVLMMPGRCPLCQGGVADGGVTLAFYQCSWDIEAFHDVGKGIPVKLCGAGLEGTASGSDGFKTWSGQGS